MTNSEMKNRKNREEDEQEAIFIINCLFRLLGLYGKVFASRFFVQTSLRRSLDLYANLRQILSRQYKTNETRLISKLSYNLYLRHILYVLVATNVTYI